MLALPILLLASCTTDENEKAIHGTWYINQNITEVKILPASHPKAEEIKQEVLRDYSYKSITFNRAGTFAILYAEEPMMTRAKMDVGGNFELAENGIISLDTESESRFWKYYILNNELTLTIDASGDFDKSTDVTVILKGKKR